MAGKPTFYGLPRSMFGSRLMRFDSGDGPPVAPAPSNGDPAADPKPSVDPVAAARDLLIAEGHQVLDSTAFHGIKTKAAAAAEAKLAELQAKHDSLQGEHGKLADWKTKLDNEGKSESELMAQRQIAWEKTNTENQAALKASEKRADEALGKLAQERVENRLVGLLANSNDTEMALLWARKEIGEFLSTDESGHLVWTQPDGIKIEGKAAGLKVAEWWAMDRQKSLQSGVAPGPPAKGAPAATPPATGFTPDPSKSEMENYLAAEAHDRNRRK